MNRARGLLCLLLAVLLIWAGGCGSLPTPFVSENDEDGSESVTPVADVVSAPAPSGVPAMSGKLLMVKDGGVWAWQDGKLKRVTVTGQYSCATWSPDGKKIAAVVMGENHSDLVILNPAGTKLDQLTDNLSNVLVKSCAWARSPSWSPDGSTLAYASDLRGLGTVRGIPGPVELCMVDANGDDAPYIEGNPASAYDIDYPSWSPDGSYLALTGFVGGVGQIFVLDVESGSWAKITDIEGGAQDPAWSPDGQTIAFVVRTGLESDIWAMSSDGSGQTRITKHGNAGAPVWSPDGKVIAYLAGEPSADLFAVKYTPGAEAQTGQSLTSGARIDIPSGLSWNK